MFRIQKKSSPMITAFSLALECIDHPLVTLSNTPLHPSVWDSSGLDSISNKSKVVLKKINVK